MWFHLCEVRGVSVVPPVRGQCGSFRSARRADPKGKTEATGAGEKLHENLG